MYPMKKLTALILALTLCLLCGCGGKTEEPMHNL